MAPELQRGVGMDVTHLLLQAAAPLAPGRAEVRRIVGALLRACADVPLLAFHVSDIHLHLVAAVDRVAAGRIAQRVVLVLRPPVSGGVRGGAYTVVRDVAHLQSTFEYVLRNDEKHGVAPDPWRENSAIPDLLGLRTLHRALIPTVRRTLPRLNGSMLRSMAGWPELAIGEAPPTVDAAVAAVLAALGRSDLTGRGDDVVSARRVLAHLLPTTPGLLGAALGRSVESLRLLRAQPPRDDLLRATRLQLALQAAVPLPALAPYATVGAPPAWSDAPRFLRGKPRRT